MAIHWGPYSSHMRVGIGVTQRPGSVGQGTTSVALDLEVWVQMDGSSSQFINNGSIVFTGAWFGSATIPINLGPGQSARVWATTTSFPTIVGQGQNKTFGATVSHLHGTSYHGVVWWIAPRPAAPPAKPSTPTAVKATRSSDGRHTVAWTRQSTYTSVLVQRRTNGGTWAQVGRPSGNAASWVDTSTKGNAKYEYRVAGVSAGGQSGWSSASAAVFTTPGTVGSVTATRIGSNIRVSAGSLPAHATHFDIEDNGTVIATAIARASLPYTHSNPSTSATHRYRMRARVASGGANSSTLFGPWSAWSSTVQLTAPPNAPSGLAPNGLATARENVTLSWRHNPTDSSAQTYYQLRARLAGESAWSEKVAVASASTSVTVSTFDLTPEAGLVEWQVRTRGVHASFSPWSATATLDVLDKPQATIVAPGPDVDNPVLTVEWEWFQAQGRPQSSWEITLLSEDQEVVEELSGSGPATSATLRTRLEDGKSYSLLMRLGTGGVWSDSAFLAFSVSFVPPVPPVMSAEWDESIGAATISVGESEAYSGEPITNFFTNPRLLGDGTYSVLNRNYQRNPDAVGTAHYSGANEGSSTKMVLANTVSAGMSAVRGWVTEYDKATAYLSLSASSAKADAVPTSAGRVHAVRALVHSSTGDVTVRVDFYGSAGKLRTEISDVFTVSKNTVNAGTPIEFMTRGPAEATHFTVSFGFPPLHPGVQVGSWVVVGSPMIATGWTEEFALLAIRDYVSPNVGGTDPDFTYRWTGDLNGSESVKEIERVRGFSPSGTGTVAGVSSLGGKPAVRLISGSDGNNAYVSIPIPEDAKRTGVVRGTLVVKEGLGPDSRKDGIKVEGSPIPSDQVDKTKPGIYELSSFYVGGTRAQFYHGDVLGSPDVWWTDIGIFPEGYEGEVFHGGSGYVETGNGPTGVMWEGEPDNSRSITKPLPDAVRSDLLRSFDGGLTWEPVSLGGDVSFIMNDWEAASNGETMYRAILYTAVGASSYVDVTLVADSEAMWLGGGAGYGVVARLPFDPQLSIDVGRARSVQKYEGRKRGVAYASQHLDRTVSAGMTVYDGDEECATLEEVEAVAHADSAVHLYRDPDGRRVYGALSAISLSRGAVTSDGVLWAGTFQLDETDH